MIRILLVTLALFVLTACHGLSYVNQVENQGYVQFEGNFSDSEVLLNDQHYKFDEHVETFEIDGKTVAKFPLETGSYQLKVLRKGKVVVYKNLFISHGQTASVIVP